MKISVDRTLESHDSLIFTITVTEPHDIPFEGHNKFLLKTLQSMQKSLSFTDEDTGFKDDLETALHGIQSMLFHRSIDSLRFSIDNELKPKFDHICQEIYNFLFDHQKGDIKSWLQEFDPQRVIYYFDNDKTVESDFGEEDGEQMDSEQSLND